MQKAQYLNCIYPIITALLNNIPAMNILIIDDEDNSRLYLGELLKRYFPEIKYSYAADATEALIAIGQNDFDLLLLDIAMPGMSGLEFLELLRNNRKDIHTCIISAHSNFDYACQSIQLGVSDYLVKPVSRSSLQKCIDKVKESTSKNQLILSSPKGKFKISTTSVVAIEKTGRNIMDVYTHNSIIKGARGILSDMIKALTPDFIYINRQCIVNANEIMSFNSKSREIALHINNQDITFIASRENIKEIANRFN